MNEQTLLSLASGGTMMTLTPQAGISKEAAAAAVPAVAEQVINRAGKEEVVVNGPMLAGRTPSTVPITGSTFSQIGVEVEEFITFYLDGTGSTNTGAIAKKMIFDAWGMNACKSACSGTQGLAAIDGNMRIFGEGNSNCDSLAMMNKVLNAGFAYDIMSIRAEDVTGGGSADLDYSIFIHRSNFNGTSSTRNFRLAEMLSSGQFNERIIDSAVPSSVARIDPSTAWELPVKAGKKLKITLRFSKRYQHS
jgi:hypothetical protein